MKRAKERKQRLLNSLLSIFIGCLAAPLVACGSQGQQASSQMPAASTAAAEPSASSKDAATEQAPRSVQTAASDSRDITTEQVRKFASAHPEMLEVQVRYLEPLQQAQTHAEGRMLLEQAMQELKEVVERHGLTLQEFKEIADAAGRDPKIRRQIEDLLASH